MPPLMPMKTSRPAFLHAIDDIVVEGRDLAVLLRAQTLEPGLAGMNPDGVGAGVQHPGDEIRQHGFRVLLVNADAAFDRDRHARDLLHRRDARGHHIRRLHQTGAEGAGLNAVGRAADIEVDLVIGERFGDAHRLGQLCRIGAAELQRDRVFRRVMAEQPVSRPVDDRVRNHHLRIKQRVAADLPVEVTAMAVGPVDHRRDGENRVLITHRNRDSPGNHVADRAGYGVCRRHSPDRRRSGQRLFRFRPAYTAQSSIRRDRRPASIAPCVPQEKRRGFHRAVECHSVDQRPN